MTSFLWQSLAPFCPFPATHPLPTMRRPPQGYPHSPALTTISSLPETSVIFCYLLPILNPQPFTTGGHPVQA